MAALEQLRAPYAEWVSGTVALAQQPPGAIAALAPQQAPAAQVGGGFRVNAFGRALANGSSQRATGGI